MTEKVDNITGLISWLKSNDTNLETSKRVSTLLKLVKGRIGLGAAAEPLLLIGPISRSSDALVLENEQKLQLLSQVQAFKRLSRNLPVTPDLMQAAGCHTLGYEEERERSVKNSFVRPPTMLQSSNVGKELVASATSEAMSMAQEKEIRLCNRIQYRLEELKALPTNIVPTLKKKAHIEIKQLKLLDLQKKIRTEISSEVQHSLSLESSFDLDAYRKTSRHGDSHPQEAEEAEEGERSEVRYTNQRRFLIALHYHAKEFKEFHFQRDKQIKKMMKQLQIYHREKEKRIQRQEELNKRARLEALRLHDVDGYRKLLSEAKDERLNTLIQQTDAFLAQMGVLVQRERSKDSDDKKDEQTSGDASSSKTYYTAAHSIQEEITSQPDMLVGGQLKEYQMSGLQWLISLYNNKLNGILADEMGLGKTIQTIAMLSYLIEKKGNNGPYLVAVPLSTLSNWTNEFAKWAPKIATIVYKGKPQTRKQLFNQQVSKGKFNVLMTSFDIIVWCLCNDEYLIKRYIMHDKSDLGKVSWEYLILDEGHRIKNKTSKLSITLRQYSSKHRLLLTGTPLQNDLGELWSLLNFLLPTIFNSMDNFENWFNAPFAYEKTKNNKPTIAIGEEETLIVINRLHQVLRPFLLRRLKSDVESQLPDKVERVLKCNLSSMQLVMYKQMVEAGTLATDPNAVGTKKVAKGFNNVIMQLQKICNHPYLFRDEWDVDENVLRASGKFELMDRMLQKLKVTHHRVLIFTQMTHIITIMEEYFSLREYDYLRLDGSTKQEDRADMVKEWNRPDSPYFIFVLSTHAGGLGLNLQTADTVIIFDTDWNPHMDLQAADRCHRIGQTQEVRVFRLVCANTVEEKILERANFKLDIDAKIIQAGMFNQHADDDMRRQMLESLMKDLTDTTDEDEIVTSNEQLNPLLARSDEELEIFQKMDEEQEAQQVTKRPRLIAQDELPAWMLEDPIEQRRKKEIEYGRGFRQRADVTYDDGLTERQFMRMMEKGVDGKRQKRSQRKASSGDMELEPDDTKQRSTKRKRMSDNEGSESSEGENNSPKHKKSKGEEDGDKSEEGESDAEEVPTKRRGRPRKGENDSARPATKRRKVESDDEALEDGDDNALPQEKSRKKETRGRKPKGKSLKDRFKAIWHRVRSAVDEHGRVLSAMFMTLPSAEEYPDYYDVIEQPMSLLQIKNAKFANKDEFKAAFELVFSNAQEFNMVGSQVYDDAEALQAIFVEEFNAKFSEENAIMKSEEDNEVAI